jgi:hypothetical protein
LHPRIAGCLIPARAASDTAGDPKRCDRFQFDCAYSCRGGHVGQEYTGTRFWMPGAPKGAVQAMSEYRLPATEEAPRHARALLARDLGDSVSVEDREVAQLLVSELVTNAVRHTPSDVIQVNLGLAGAPPSGRNGRIKLDSTATVGQAWRRGGADS